MPAQDNHLNPGQLAANLYFDRIFGCEAVKVLPGEYFVSDRDMVMVTVLGSCVAACVRDPERGIGGINHFMLPDSMNGESALVPSSARYGAHAMQLLLDQLAKLGARREKLEAKVFGGGRVMASLASSQVGDRNAQFVLRYLEAEGIRVVAQDLGDFYPRKVYFFPVQGRVLVKKLISMQNDTLARREREYEAQLHEKPGPTDVALLGPGPRT